MIYVLKFFIRIALQIFCEDIRIKNKALTKENGPLLLLANHPDSFLDAIIIGAIYDRKVHFLARGDVFQNPIFGYLLRSIGMIPIFRAREGKEHLHKNASTFDESVQIIQNGGAVLIFIEGLCLNTNTLLPYKKGASRIVEQLQEKGVEFNIHVATLAYNDFHSIRKQVHVAFQKLGEIPVIQEAKNRVEFNEAVRDLMQKEVVEQYARSDKKLATWHWIFYPYYWCIKQVADKKTNGTVFYDSVLFALLFFTFPILLGIVSFCVLAFC
jgi:1-acyl-sn-glycerol-3-phosphate acyltransferase